MKRILTNLFSFPFEVFIFLIGFGVFVTLYVQLIFVPLFISSSIGLALLLSEVIGLWALYAFAGVGALIGLVWAERVRRKYSIFGFHGYLLGHPEIDGWQRPKEGVVFRNGNLTNQ